jgi:hypothetical protein
VAGLSTAINTVLEGYSQDAGTSINSEDNEISLKTNSVARLQISNLGGSSIPSRIDLNLGNLTASTDTVHGELRFARGDNSALRYHSILTKHSNAATRSALAFNIHDPSVSSSPVDTGQREVLKLQGDGKCGINLTSDPTEALEVNGNVKCDDVKYPITDTGGTVSNQSLVSLHSTVSSLSTSLSDYALTSALSSYALANSLSSYALTSSLSSYALTSALSSYALTSTLSDYVLSAQFHRLTVTPLAGLKSMVII